MVHLDSAMLGFDPRGVGRSQPATCFPTAQQEQAAGGEGESFPLDDLGDEVRFGRETAEFAVRCQVVSGDRMRHMSTANVARDMHLLMQAVGDEALTYAGYSYGTFLGQTFARLFPDDVRAMVLDGVVEPVAYTGSNGDLRPLDVR